MLSGRREDTADKLASLPEGGKGRQSSPVLGVELGEPGTCRKQRDAEDWLRPSTKGQHCGLNQVTKERHREVSHPIHSI